MPNLALSTISGHQVEFHGVYIYDVSFKMRQFASKFECFRKNVEEAQNLFFSVFMACLNLKDFYMYNKNGYPFTTRYFLQLPANAEKTGMRKMAFDGI